MKRWLITGVPGSGKTSIGNYLESNCDFQHFDLENQAHFQNFVTNSELIIPTFTKSNVVITWGFVSDTGGLEIISFLRANGFKMLWFDGNRVASFKAFLKRATVSEELYYLQMHRIESSGVVNILDPILINPFNADHSFKTPEEIVKKLQEN